jgi:hypothetical protein
VHAPPDAASPPESTLVLDNAWLATRPWASHFCEENAWWVAAAPDLITLRTTVVMITNPRRSVAMWQQRAAVTDPIVWDYHVVVVLEPGEAGSGALVIDADCRAGAVLSIDEWLAASFPVEVSPDYAPQFRLISGLHYLEHFVSDRSHMLDADGKPLQPFPPWAALGVGDGKANTLFPWLDLTQPSPGDVVDLDGLAERFGLMAMVEDDSDTSEEEAP